MKQVEKEIIKILLKDEDVKKQFQPIYYWCDTGRDLSKLPYQNIVLLNRKQEGGFLYHMKLRKRLVV